MCLSMCGCIFVCMYVYVCVCVYVHVHEYTFVYVCAWDEHTFMCDVRVCMCACTRVHVCMCACVLERMIQLLLSHSTPLADTNHHQAESLWHSAWTYSCSFWFLTLFPILWWHNHWWWVQIRGRGHQHLSTDVHNLSGNSYFLAWSSGCCLQPWQKV